MIMIGGAGVVTAASLPLALRGAFAPPAVPQQPDADPGVPAPPAPGPTTLERSPDRGHDPLPDVRPPGFRKPLADLAAYRSQRIDWRACGQFRCAEVTAPLDWDVPDAEAITLALRQRPATRTPKLGTLFINPGGPGESGTRLVEWFRATGLERYDIVGWDPRGTGGSTPVRCASAAELDELHEVDSSPDSPAEFDELVQAWRGFGKACARNSGPLLEAVTTADTAKDLDLLRELVGDEKLNYLGYSYGTIIGQAYVELFADKVGRLVLDSVAPLQADDTGQRGIGGGATQVQGFDASIGAFADWCAGRGDCGLGQSREEVLGAVTDLLDRLDARPIAVGDRRLTQSLATTGILASLYQDARGWPQLALAIAGARGGDGRALLAAADSYNGRGPNGSYAPSQNAFYAINCVDASDAGVDQARADYEEAAKQAPTFGKYFGPSVTCPTWPVQAGIPVSQFHPEVPDFLVVGVTGDPATPYAWSEGYAGAQPGATLITLDGTGHTAYGRNECVNAAVVDYLVRDRVPGGGLTCR